MFQWMSLLWLVMEAEDLVDKYNDESLFHISNANLTSVQPVKLEQFLSKNRDVFSTSLETLGKTDIFMHKIETEPGAKPVHMNHYRTGPVQKAEIERQTKEMLDCGIISQSSSVWHSPVVLVKKKNSSWRFAIDYRKLNQITKLISHPLPRLEDVFDQGRQFKMHFFFNFAPFST